jgi:iron complex outermembrane receptor protein
LYYDRTVRTWPAVGLDVDQQTFDIDFQHTLPMAERHSLIWGWGYRRVHDQLQSAPLLAEFAPPSRSIDQFSYFVQDEIELVDDAWYLTVGSKFEHNEYTQFEVQPTVRLLWTPSERYSVWGSISRAVRVPTRAERDISALLSPPVGALPNPFPPPALIPAYAQFLGSRDMESEDLLSFEIGMRGQPAEWLSWDFAMFFHDYDDLRSLPIGSVIQPGFPILLPAVMDNGKQAKTYGFEWWSRIELCDWWWVFGGYSFLVTNGDTRYDGGDPRNQIYLQSSWNLGPHLQLDAIWRYVDNVAFTTLNPATMLVPHYNALDLRLAWQCDSGCEVALVGRNLIDAEHYEYISDIFFGNTRTEVPREIYAMLTWKY